ncbi:hydantoinase/oxoprolinase family protein [Spirillospora sp. NPDC047279]|uniref:hydantoinase/oxoprolinase family protein n=1 Tax=Spirillospora sp. NPDC047279 TaxID=3155478 RepID=UPI0033DA42DC
MTLRIGVDVGGTFTDVFLHDSVNSRFWLAKTPSTPGNQAEGVIRGIVEICAKAGLEPARLDAVLHGTTVATNALLEGKGSRVGLITSYGWRNILHLADSWTPGPLFGFFSYQPPEPVVPYERVRQLNERITADGEIVIPLDDSDVERQVRDLVGQDVEALTVSLMHAYAHPDHEVRVAKIAAGVLAELGVDIPVSLSSDVSPEFREYERAVTTVLNSYLGPVMQRYLSALEVALRDVPVTAGLQVVRSDGGLMSVAGAQAHPIQTALSGPSGGVNGAAFVAKRAGFDKIITFDMGGTSSDVAVCIGGIPEVTRETKVAAFPVRAPAINVETIGAGGGSIASVSEVTGGLRVGPASAGAQPGPACYGRGGELPTVTDANLVLGHLPTALLGGDMTLDVEAAVRAHEPLAAQLNIDVHSAAQAVVDIVNGNMLGALRVATVQKGLNPREFSLLSFGGAGGLHANALAAELGAFPVIVPPEAGVLSALGFVVADVQNEFCQAFLGTVDDIDVTSLRATLHELDGRAAAWLEEEGVPAGRRNVRHVLDMRYRRQGYEIPVEFDGDASTLGLDELKRLFHDEHHRLYGFDLPAPIEIVTVRSRAIGRTEKVDLEPGTEGPADASAAQAGTQPSWVDGALSDIPVYDRALLAPGMRVEGKAVITQYDSTVLVLPGHTARVDPWFNLLIEEAR